VVWADVSTSLRRDERGQPVYFMTTLLDITERKQAEAQIKDLLELNEKVINSSPIGILTYKLSGECILANQNAAAILGTSVEQLEAQNFHTIASWKSSGLYSLVERAIASRVPGTADLHLLSTFGRDLWLTAHAVTFTSQKEEHVLLTISDITERIKAEAEIRKLNEELEDRVALRTQQLEAANKELESFSYSVSHDLRAPLRSIDGFSQALLEDYGDQLPQEGHSYLKRVRASAQRMAELIDDMLNLSRVTRAPFEPGTVDLSRLAQTIASELERSEPGRGVEFSITPDLTARGDARLLQIVLENLLGNAWKFTSKRTDARVEFGSKNENGQSIYFVRDNGAGFDMTYAGKLFGAFQRLHAMTEYSGTGIGLATVQRIMHRHGGRVWSEGAVDQGATFYFTL